MEACGRNGKQGGSGRLGCESIREATLLANIGAKVDRFGDSEVARGGRWRTPRLEKENVGSNGKASVTGKGPLSTRARELLCVIEACGRNGEQGGSGRCKTEVFHQLVASVMPLNEAAAALREVRGMPSCRERVTP